MDEGIRTAFLGLMPPRKFLSEFFPRDASEAVSSAFKPGLFDELDELVTRGGRMEKMMYGPFCTTMGPIIPNLSIRNISSQPITEANGYCEPDCVVYRKGDDVGVTRTDLASVEFFIEFKWSSISDPFPSPTLPAGTSDELCRMSLDENSEATDVMDQIGTYVALQMDSQYRTHTFFVFIVGNYARLMRWDRSGIIVTDRIKYNTEPELVEFFERYNAAPPEISAARGMYPNFDLSLLAVEIQNEGLHERPKRYIINSPVARPSLPIGRSTRTSIAYDVQRKKLVFMKDSWPVFLREDMMEGRVYQRLNENNVQNIPLCVDFSDGDGLNHETHTQRFTCELGSSFPRRRHHRLILDTVGKPLKEFASSRELVRAVRAAIIAHRDAYLMGVLHCDISSGNILITDNECYQGGLLIDWDLCQSKDLPESQASLTGTWQFLSPELIMHPQIPHSFIHDLESAYFVLLFFDLGSMAHTFSDWLTSNMWHDVMNPRRYESGGGYQRYTFMALPSSMQDFIIPSNLAFSSLMDQLHTHFNSRYTLLRAKSITAAQRAVLQLASFVTEEQYADCSFKHDVVIGIIQKALESPGWPADDSAIRRRILHPIEDVAQAASSLKRSRLQYESESNGYSLNPGGRSSKRLNSSSPA